MICTYLTTFAGHSTTVIIILCICSLCKDGALNVPIVLQQGCT